MIEPAIWELYKNELTSGGETWGIIKLGYRPPDDTVKPKIPGKIKLTGFKNFCPYTVDLEYYKDMRSHFSIVVLKGSIISQTDDDSIYPVIKDRRKKVKVNAEWILLEDVLCKSPSFAAMLVMGKKANGLTSWKTKDGKTLKSLETN